LYQSKKDKELILQFSQIRKEKNISLGKASQVTGIDKGNISNIEKMKISASRRNLEKMAYFSYKRGQ